MRECESDCCTIYIQFSVADVFGRCVAHSVLLWLLSPATVISEISLQQRMQNSLQYGVHPTPTYMYRLHNLKLGAGGGGQGMGRVVSGVCSTLAYLVCVVTTQP